MIEIFISDKKNSNQLVIEIRKKIIKKNNNIFKTIKNFYIPICVRINQIF